MAKELFISTTPHETKVAVVEDEQLAEIYFERENEYTLAGSIYKGRVTRVLPGMQSAFVDVGLERDAFLYVTDFLEEQEDREEFEQVVTRVHSEAHQQPQQQPPAALETEDEGSQAASGHSRAPEQDGAAQQFDRGTRRWRGRRGRRRGRGEFREQNPPQNVAAPPHAAAEEAGHEGRQDEPVLLPGESLSKYRHPEPASEQNHSAAASEYQTTREEHRVEAPQPVSERTPEQRGASPRPPAENVGSMAVLPGESISKYRSRNEGQSESSESLPQSSTPPQDRAQGRSGSRWERPGRAPERQHSEAPSGPPVFSLPGESLAKYRGKEPSPCDTDAGDETHRPEPAALAQPISGAHEHSSTELTRHVAPAVAGSEQRQSDGTTPNITYSEPESSDEQERVEHIAQDATPMHAPAASLSQLEIHRESGVAFEDGNEVEASEQGDAQVAHEFGSGVLEEEVIEEDETELLPLGDHMDEDIYEELEEETLDAENAEQLVEAVREAHVIQRLGLREGEPPDLEDHPAGEEVRSFLPREEREEEREEEDERVSGERLEAAGGEDARYQDDGESEGGSDEEGDRESEGEEGRAELRAPSNTAGFQQRSDRQERGPQDRFRRGRGGRPMRGRRNIQRESQPTISDLLKEGQEILVQIAKEPMAKKGARITSHIALPGRFLVYMPTVNHVGVSRKIGSDEERQRLKRVLLGEKGSAHGGFIVRTAAAGASEEDLRSDLRFLINLWNDIKSRSDASKAPALIYHDLNLVERILRDQVTSNFTSIWVDNEQEYERIVRFLGRFQSSMVRRAKLYTKDTPLFEQFGIQEEINNALKSKVWLKSGGYIVINQTEALVAIDINTGKYVGKTQRLEDTIVKTNIDAIREIVRQIRLRDLGGIIVIDFIDMDERKNRQKVMQALEEALKSDRAPSKVLQFNDFGLVAITRKRVKQSLERTLSTSCSYCTGTGMIKSVQTVCNEIYVEMRKMSKALERHDVMLRVNPEVVKALKSNGARWLQEMEELTGKTIIVKSDPLLHQEQFDIN